MFFSFKKKTRKKIFFFFHLLVDVVQQNQLFSYRTGEATQKLHQIKEEN